MSSCIKILVKGLTWAYRRLDDEINSKTELRGGQDEKRAAHQLVLPGHSVYPKAHLIQTRIRFDLEGITGP